MGRRADGEGTIVQRANGTWQASYSLGVDSEGKRLRRVLYGKTKKDVQTKLAELKHELTSGTYSESKLTVKSYLEQWLKEKSRKVKASTIDIYRHCVEAHIVPRIGHLRLNKLTPLSVQKMVSTISDEVGAPSANKSRVVLSNALTQALKLGLIARNPVTAVDTVSVAKREMTLWTPQEAVRFLAVARSHRLYALFYLAMSTGLRRGELLGLRWKDVKGESLRVHQTLSISKGKAVISTPKTKASSRYLGLSSDTVSILAEHRRQAELEAHERGSSLSEDDLVFTSKAGTPYNPHNVARDRKALMDKAKVPQVRLHDLRHLHASLAIASGMNPKAVADRLGHARASFTLDVYTHLFEEAHAKEAVSIQNYLEAA